MPAAVAKEGRGRLVASYVYQDAAGMPLHRTLRYADPKGFAQQRWDGERWQWGLAGLEPVLYQLPALIAADPSEPVLLCEGEKDADRLTALGLLATTNPMGASSWRSSYSRWLRGRHVVILEDNDIAGRARTAAIVAGLTPLCPTVRIVRFPGLPVGGDVSDWLDAGGDVSTLRGEAAWREAVPA